MLHSAAMLTAAIVKTFGVIIAACGGLIALPGLALVAIGSFLSQITDE